VASGYAILERARISMKKFREILKYFSTDFQSIIHTNDWRGYDGLVVLGYEKHHRVQHGNNKFVNSKSYFNGIENFRGYR